MQATLKATSYDREYYDEHKSAGLDYFSFGDWQRNYGEWLTQSLGIEGKSLLDVGCACGSIAAGLSAHCRVTGIDLNNHMIELGRGGFRHLPLYVCDSVNLHLFPDETFDCIHSNQVAEHFRPEHVPLILAEWRRVLKPGGLVFCVLDTVESMQRQGQNADMGDPTHICIKPLDWWIEACAEAGFSDCKADYESAMRAHRLSYLSKYDWDWWLMRKPVEPATPTAEESDGEEA